jgi:hypothetical protein
MTTRLAVVLTLGVLLGATLYETLVAFEVVDLGAQPGEGPPGERMVALIAVCAMLVAAGLAVVAAVGASVPFVPLLAPAAAAFLAARFYTFDPYYLPDLRRFADDGMLPPVLVWCIVATAVGAGLFTRANWRVGAALSAPAILACAFFGQVLVGGH